MPRVIAVVRVQGQIFQRVIHPAEIPFVIKAQSAVLRRGSDLEIVGGILCHQHDLRIRLPQIIVGVFEKPYAGVIDVAVGVSVFEYQLGDRVIAQTVDVIHLNPEIQGGFHKGQRVRLGVVEQHGSPFRVPLRLVARFIDKAAVELVKTEEIGHEMQRYHIENHADARLMTAVNQFHQTVGLAVAAGGGKITGCLIAPRTVKRVFRQRHQLDMGKALFLYIGNQLIGELTIGEHPSEFLLLRCGRIRAVVQIAPP